MSSIGTGYDLSASQFSPDGRVFQVEYAMKAVDNSGTVLGIRTRDSVVLAVEKIVTSKLYEDSAGKRIFNVDQHIGMAICGLISDARQIVDIAVRECNDYRERYGIAIPVKYLADRVSMYMHAYTLYSAVRPYGCSVLIASYENDKPYLYAIDPSGVAYGYFGCAIGKAKETAKTELEKLKFNELSGREAVFEAARIIYTVHDELKDKHFELEMSWVGPDIDGRHVRVARDLVAEAEKKAKQAIEDDSDSDNEV